MSAHLSRSDVEAFVSRVSFSGLLKTLGARLELMPFALTDLQPLMKLCITATVPDRITGEPSAVSVALSVMAVPDEGTLASMVRRLLLDFMRHEADESLLLDGVRRFDPHRGAECEHPFWQYAIKPEPLSAASFMGPPMPELRGPRKTSRCTVCGAFDVPLGRYDPVAELGAKANAQIGQAESGKSQSLQAAQLAK